MELSLPHLILLVIIIGIPFFVIYKVLRIITKSKKQPHINKLEAIDKLHELKNKGAITENEYEIQKAAILK